MTFLEKYQLLKKSIPVPALEIDQSTVDCEYSNFVKKSKSCYYCFDGYFLQDGIYTILGWGNKLVDCTAVIQSEKCYQCVDCNKCYSSTSLKDCNNSTDCHFSAFLNSCNDCFGCVALTHKKYCILNIQYTKDEYLKKVEELKKENPEKIFAQMLELKKLIPHPASQQFNSENCPYGDYIYDSRNSYWVFISRECENSGYIFESGGVKNCWDLFFSGGTNKNISERCYELMNSNDCYDCTFLSYSFSCTNCYYSTNLNSCNDCFGCVGLTNKKYCILNNQFTKDQYEKAVREIKKELGWRLL